MKTLLMVLSLALSFAVTAVQAEETNLSNSFQIDQAAVQLAGDSGVECAEFTSEAANQAADGSEVEQTRCCRTCTTGKACGDSCIAKNKTCHKGRGCACNG